MRLSLTEKRLLACLLDVGIVMLFLLPLSLWITETNHTDFAGWAWVPAVLFALAYLAIGDSFGQTLGKRVFGLRVVDLSTGSAIGVKRGVIRRLIFYLGGIAFAAGWLVGLADPKRRTLHDRAAGTVVVQSDR